MNALITPAEADTLIHGSLPLTGTVKVPLERAIGRIVRESIRADRPLPPYRRATMDGIAFRKRAGEGLLKIAGLHAAGDSPPRPLAAGEAWEIMTGALVPADCDTLVPYEEVEIDGSGLAKITGRIEPGTYIHEIGSDAAKDKLLVTVGSRIGAVELAIAASVGLEHLLVSALPVISIITTGDEAIPVGDSPQPWQIRRSNGPMLAALLLAKGPHTIHSEHVVDDPELLTKAVDTALTRSDLILLCGGISKGKRDHVRGVLESRLGPPAFHGVAQRPGKPLAFWNGPPPVFALPGNPISVLATFTRYVLPALGRIQGLATPSLARLPLIDRLQPSTELTWLLHARINANGQALPLPPKNSGDFVSVAGATHLLEIPPGGSTLAKGHSLAAYPI